MQREDVPANEAQVAGVGLGERRKGPEVATAADTAQSATAEVAVAGCGIECTYGVGRILLELPAGVEGSYDVEFSSGRSIRPGRGEARGEAAGGHHESNRARVVHRLDGGCLIVGQIRIHIQRSVPEVVEPRQVVPVVVRVAVTCEEELRMLDGIGHRLVSRLVAVGSESAEAGIHVAFHVVQRHVAIRVVGGWWAHRILTSPLVVRSDVFRAVGIPDSAKSFREHVVGHLRVVGDGLYGQVVGRYPDRPAPHDVSAGILDVENCQAVCCRHAVHVEGDVAAIGSLHQMDVGDHAAGGLPEKADLSCATSGVLFDVRREDGVSEVVDECSLVRSTAGGVCR